MLSFKHRMFLHLETANGELGPDDITGVIQPHGIFEVQGQAMQMTEGVQGPTSVKLII